MDDGVDEGKRATLRRFAALGAVGPFARLAERDDAGTSSDSESDARDAIAGYLAATPGAHFSKIRDDLGLETGETQYHLRQLEKRETLESHRDGDYRRYFPAHEFGEFEQVALGTLRRETPRGMVMALLRDPEATAGEIASQLGVSPPTVSKHAAALEGNDVLSREGGYTLIRPELLLTLLVRYADSFDAETVQFAREANGLIRLDP